jgi:predicted phosphodiesterase
LLRVQILSDLHTEFKPFRVEIAAEADVLVVAGDFGVADSLEGLRVLACSTDRPVVFLTGNHDYYHGIISEVNRSLEQIERDVPSFHFLNDKCTTIGDVKFIGTTLWSDFDLAVAPQEFACSVKEAINDFRCIRRSESLEFSPDDCRKSNDNARSFLQKSLGASFNGKKVVVTHFLPSPKSIHPMYSDSPLNPYFCCNCENLMSSRVALWIHGHTHISMDYYHEGTHVIANPRGYYGENKNFKGKLVLEI